MKQNVHTVMFVSSFFGVVIGFISCIHVPFLQSSIVEATSYFIVLPLSVIYFGFIAYKRRRSLQRNKDDLWLLLVLPAFCTWLSLYAMAWPTYFFASEQHTDKIVIEGVSTHSGIGGVSYDLLLINVSNSTSYNISTTKEIYTKYQDQCKSDFKVPVKSRNWWAGSIVEEHEAIAAITSFCS